MPPEFLSTTIDGPEIALSYMLADGREVIAASRAEAIAQCPFLKNLPVEQADVMLELLATPVPEKKVETPPVEAETDKRKPAIEKQSDLTDKSKNIKELVEDLYPIEDISSAKEITYEQVEVKFEPEATILIEPIEETFAYVKNIRREIDLMVENAIIDHDDHTSLLIEQDQLEQTIEYIKTEAHQPQIIEFENNTSDIPTKSIISPLIPITANEIAQPVINPEAKSKKKEINYLEQVEIDQIISDVVDKTYQEFSKDETEQSDVDVVVITSNTYYLPELNETDYNSLFVLPEPNSEDEVELTTHETEVAEFSTELNALFVSDISEIQSESEVETIKATKTAEILALTFDELIENIKSQTEEIVLIENALLVEELLKVIDSLEVTDNSIVTITAELIEPLFKLIELNGDTEIKQMLIDYAKNHTKEEFIELISSYLKDLTKQIDNQLYLLSVLSKQLNITDNDFIFSILGRTILSRLLPIPV